RLYSCTVHFMCHVTVLPEISTLSLPTLFRSRVDQGDHRQTQAGGLTQGDFLGLEVGDEDGIGNAVHVGDAAERELKLGQLGLHRSEEHTSALQSRANLVCRLLLEITKINIIK